ncbi:alpha/beta hydrolase fold protein [Haloterrigena salina JCM 13891]|uniref:Alpha/beta hydrolase fold protein n=1 Tax=Haloterrigena salina JCM 13891 TaxID=1227488 RepID=M0C5F3_9EURY|nr:alpha/beta hydrolase [Haloterrigena salina]ELZ18445.1 alpha/beta hydrolase fold protein [Haloterrigena salina JCM 13891]
MNHDTWSESQAETTVTVDGHELSVAYRDEGEGEPVVFLHGIPTWSFLWRRIAPQVAEQFRTIVPDFVGYGNSDRRDAFDRSIRAQEQVVAGLVDRLGLEAFHVVGHDIGGGVALRYAAHTDDRIDKLVLSNATAYGSWPVEYVTSLGLPRTLDMDADAFRERLDHAFVEGLERADPKPEWVDGMTEPWLRTDGRRAFARAAVATNTNHTTEIDYDAIDAELLCLWGVADAEQPVDDGRRLVDDIGGELVALEDAGHWVTEDRPDAYRDRLEAFLAE